MGTWGAGNFENDAALDQLGSSTDGMIQETMSIIGNAGLGVDEGLDEAMAIVNIISVLCRELGAVPPKSNVVTEWQKQALRVFDAEIDDLDPEPGFKEARRKVVEDTFGGLLTAARNFWKS